MRNKLKYIPRRHLRIKHRTIDVNVCLSLLYELQTIHYGSKYAIAISTAIRAIKEQE